MEDGIVSQQVIKNGFDSVALESIDGDFFVEPLATRKRHVVMFAGGSGITPLMSMIKSLLTLEQESSISLIYSNQSISKIIFRKDLEGLQREYADRLKIYHVITREENLPKDFPLFFKGRLPKIVIKKLLKTITPGSLDTEYYICGPHDFTKLIQESISSLNTGEIKVFIEHFFIPDSRPNFDFTQLAPRTVTLRTTDGEKSVVVDGGRSILQAAIDNNIKVPYSCTQGQCGTCRAELLSGEVKLRKNHALTEQELDAGQILLCQGFP
ncbi:MAG TPA: 2Fe-2S iron-sulfur cluster-binding protein, partial [Cyclobacteriaceae bacterium]|nr:2Fe-2S iron-sulfur cluster-binding protein [Cyclobacteriaceae bacterium]